MNSTTTKARFRLQDEEYGFPYHYLVDFSNPWPQIRTTRWGWEYYSYVNQVHTEIEMLKPNSILDVGCGDGLLLNSLSGVTEKTGLDLSKRSIDFAKAFASDTEFHVESVDDWTKPADIVTLIEVIEHIPDDQLSSFLTQSAKLAKEYILISVPTDVFPVSEKHYRHYNEALLEQQTAHLDFEIVWQKRVFKRSLLTKILTRISCNKIFQINSKFFSKQLWRIFTKFCLHANSDNGVHLIALLKRKTR